MSLIKHATDEMNLDWPESDEMQDMVKHDVLELMQVFVNQGHSGTSAPYVINLFCDLAKYKIISPLTGADDEWVEHSADMFQNKRCGTVFKDGKDSQAYWIDGYIFRDKDGCTYTNRNSRVFIDFPWTQPESEYIDVEE
jgi:hypothetical protein